MKPMRNSLPDPRLDRRQTRAIAQVAYEAVAAYDRACLGEDRHAWYHATESAKVETIDLVQLHIDHPERLGIICAKPDLQLSDVRRYRLFAAVIDAVRATS